MNRTAFWVHVSGRNVEITWLQSILEAKDQLGTVQEGQEWLHSTAMWSATEHGGCVRKWEESHPTPGFWLEQRGGMLEDGKERMRSCSG